MWWKDAAEDDVREAVRQAGQLAIEQVVKVAWESVRRIKQTNEG